MRIKHCTAILALLLLIGAGSLGVVVLVCQKQLIPPTRTETWIELYSGRMQIRYSWFGIGHYTYEGVDEWNNCLSTVYLKFVGPFPSEQEWVQMNSVSGWGSAMRSTSTEWAPLRYGQRGLARWVIFAGTSKTSPWDHPAKGFTDEAKKELILRYLEVARRAQDGQSAHDYRIAISGQTWYIDRPVQASDLIPVEIYLADPVPEHYYDPDSIK